MCGGIAGIIIGQSSRAWMSFFWLDALGLALGAGVGTVKGVMAGLGPTGSILVGILGGLVGGIARDLCLGDMARAVEEDMYATAAAFGGMTGFSNEAILEALGGSLDPLLDAVKAGTVRGFVGVVGCNNPKIKHDSANVGLMPARASCSNCLSVRQGMFCKFSGTSSHTRSPLAAGTSLRIFRAIARVNDG